jgi:hypothetical protein
VYLPKPRRGWQKVFRKMPVKSRIFFRFWDAELNLFVDVAVCPLSVYRGLPLKPLLGIYVPKSRRIYLGDLSDGKTFFHEASHHIVSQRMPRLYKTARGRAVEESVADIAAVVATRKMPAPRGAGWRLIEMGLRLKPCSKLRFDGDGDPHLSSKCVLAALKTKPKLIISLFP